MACWTWYPIRNADWLRAHADRSPRAWATAQGLATLPLAALGFAAVLGAGTRSSGSAFEMPFGPTPALFVGLMFAIGLLASWLGTLCWNEASQRLPTTLVGAADRLRDAVGAGLRLRAARRGAGPVTLAGIALLVAGVMWALRVRPEPLAAEGHADA